ncbi:hypothetical protein [Clostridium sardiniense]|uniref:hypothetical protein n=1 Tax=Clostridium sardiniense TaxID=29369 RepID=UPI003D340B92
MEFVLTFAILVFIALLVGRRSILVCNDNEDLNKPLYDEETLIIMKRYDLITDEQYKEMIITVKQNI